MSLLYRINRPQDLHALSEDELKTVAQEVREHIIDTVGEIGGHFGANLGTCELAERSHREARASLAAAAPGGAPELEQITDFIATRTS